jgi:hypothetical protein
MMLPVVFLVKVQLTMVPITMHGYPAAVPAGRKDIRLVGYVSCFFDEDCIARIIAQATRLAQFRLGIVAVT